MAKTKKTTNKPAVKNLTKKGFDSLNLEILDFDSAKEINSLAQVAQNAGANLSDKITGILKANCIVRIPDLTSEAEEGAMCDSLDETCFVPIKIELKKIADLMGWKKQSVQNICDEWINAMWELFNEDSAEDSADDADDDSADDADDSADESTPCPYVGEVTAIIMPIALDLREKHAKELESGEMSSIEFAGKVIRKAANGLQKQTRTKKIKESLQEQEQPFEG